MLVNIDKTYELRNLEADDLFIMVNIVSKIGIKEFKACFESEEVKAAIMSMAKQKKAADDATEEANADDSIVSVGVSVALDIASILLANISKCKDDIYALLSNLSGMKAGDIAKLPIKTFTGMIVDVVKKENFADFFQEAAKFLK